MSLTLIQEEFLEKASEQISDNPATRLSEITKNTLERNNFVFDSHCHVFDGDCVSVLYVAIRFIAGVPEGLRSLIWRIITGEPLTEKMGILETEDLVENLIKNPELIPEKDNLDKFLQRMEADIQKIEMEIESSDYKVSTLSIREFLIRYRNIIRLLASKRMSDVYVNFRDRYAINRVYNDLYETKREQVTILLGMDLNSGWDNTCEKTNSQQNEELGKLPQAHPVLPFLPIDPRRAEHSGKKNLYTFFLEAFREGSPSFFGVKCYPALGYLPTDSRLKPIFKICAEKNIPVLTHCGGEIVSTFKKPIIVNRNGIEESISLSPRKARARYLNEPKEWLEVLRTHENLKLCLGHFGGSGAWKNLNGPTGHRVETILKMMDKFNVYADFSFNLKSGKATDNFISKLEQQNRDGELMRSRTLFGTDFWVILPVSDLNSDQRTFLNKVGDLEENLLKTNVLNYLGLQNFN